VNAFSAALTVATTKNIPNVKVARIKLNFTLYSFRRSSDHVLLTVHDQLVQPKHADIVRALLLKLPDMIYSLE
jgi:hypothetical protein